MLTLALLISSKHIYEEPLIPETSDPLVATGNTLYLILVSLGASFVFVWIMRKKMIRLDYFISSLKGILCGILFWIVTLLLSPEVSEAQEYAIIGASAIIAAATISSVKNITYLSTPLSIWMTGASAFLIKLMFSNLAVGILLVGFSLFDIYDVFRGPLKHLTQTSHDKGVSPLLVKVGSIEVGLGDLLFYSLSTALAYSVGGVAVAIPALITIKIGMYITLKLLEKRLTLPGLPIPVLLSASVTFLASLIQAFR
ncbi:MAG: hypothetical protein ACUVQ8_01100 [Nitrososphaeria archaeon]